MSHSHSHADNKEERFSVPLFLFTILASLVGMGAFMAFVFPETWQAQLEAGWLSFLIVFLAAHAVCAFGEFFFHRYILHAPLFPFLSYFYKQHTLHHALTRIGYRRLGPAEEEIPCLVEVDNRYPIEHDHQREASFFPWYSLLVFTLVASPLLILFQWLFPAQPIFFGGVLAIAFSMTLYELLHAVEHLPRASWDRLLLHPRYSRFWRKAYAFHLRHHADIRCNEAISGFFGLPLPDFIFGTYIDPATLYNHGSQTSPEQFNSPQPRFGFIRWLDARAESVVRDRREKRRRA